MSTTLTEIQDPRRSVDSSNPSPSAVSSQPTADELAMLAAIQQGLDDIDAGRVASHEEVMRRSKTWITK